MRDFIKSTRPYRVVTIVAVAIIFYQYHYFKHLPVEIPPQTCYDYVVQDIKDRAQLQHALESAMAEAKADDFLIEITKNKTGNTK